MKGTPGWNAYDTHKTDSVSMKKKKQIAEKHGGDSIIL